MFWSKGVREYEKVVALKTTKLNGALGRCHLRSLNRDYVSTQITDFLVSKFLKKNIMVPWYYL